MFKEKLDELINRNVPPLANGVVGFQSLDDVNKETNIWLSDVKLFAERYLKSHPLYNDITTALFHKKLGVVGVIKGHLISIQKDDDFNPEFDSVEPRPYLVVDNFNNKENKKYDLFLSHANKDKESFVDGLYNSLAKLGIRIFYDKETIEWGDNWKAKVLDGVNQSEFAIIVISDNFFGREWTEKELSELLSRQNNTGQKIVLPILKNITIEQLQHKYPLLADIQVIDAEKNSTEEITILFAKQIIKRIKRAN